MKRRYPDCGWSTANGLVTADRESLDDWLAPFAPECDAVDFIEAIETFKPDALIGATGVPGTFTEEAVRLMARLNERPLIFALSNPTAHAECTAEQAYVWSEGRAVFASGSSFSPVEFEGTTFHPGQANNAYIFPGIGLGVSVSGAARVTESMFLAASDALASSVTEKSIKIGAVFRPLSQIRPVRKVGARKAVCEVAAKEGFVEQPLDDATVAGAIADAMYEPRY
ncbi:MAG: malic enzyme-like NAD(P)-binding protein [Halioglobus sp.]|nr:malic enzyme-like NAD(P)-binding protein [Halioglobus sp.]